MKLTDYEDKSLQAFEKSILEGKWSNEGLVSMLKLIINDYLKLKTIKSISIITGKSTQWLRKSKNVIKIDNVQFLPDND